MSGDQVDRPGNRTVRAVIWAPGLAVAIGAAAATAHGLYEVAVAARVPAGIAWLYPLITDGLALVAYTATARLDGRAARYAWAVVVIAAGLSGLAQAAFLAGQGGEVEAPAVLRFGVGAWPAVAAAIVAHLLYLLASEAETGIVVQTEPKPEAVQSIPYSPDGVQPAALAPPVLPGGELTARDEAAARAEPIRPAASPMRDRAEAVATRHARRHGAWPTVSELESAAEVSRGTAAAALKALRAAPLPAPHLLPDRTQAIDARTPEPSRDTGPETDEEVRTP